MCAMDYADYRVASGKGSARILKWTEAPWPIDHPLYHCGLGYLIRDRFGCRMTIGIVSEYIYIL